MKLYANHHLKSQHHRPDLAETISPSTRVKFLYGDILESLVLQLARDAGHEVSDEQKSVEWKHDSSGYSVRGRIDAVIDGVVVDVKSVTKMSERKFHDGLGLFCFIMTSFIITVGIL